MVLAPRGGVLEFASMVQCTASNADKQLTAGRIVASGRTSRGQDRQRNTGITASIASLIRLCSLTKTAIRTRSSGNSRSGPHRNRLVRLVSETGRSGPEVPAGYMSSGQFSHTDSANRSLWLRWARPVRAGHIPFLAWVDFTWCATTSPELATAVGQTAARYTRPVRARAWQSLHRCAKPGTRQNGLRCRGKWMVTAATSPAAGLA